MGDRLFQEEPSLGTLLKNVEQLWTNLVNNLSSSRLREANVEALIAEFSEKHGLVVPVLREELKHVTYESLQPDGKLHVIVLVPFEGDRILLARRQDPDYLLNHQPHGICCTEKELELRLVLSAPDSAEIVQQTNRLLDQVKRGLEKVDSLVRPFNNELLISARAKLRQRQEHLSKLDAFKGELPLLGFPLRLRSEEAQRVVLPVIQKPLPISNDAPPDQSPRPYLSMDNLDQVLGKVRAMMNVVERHPGAFTTLKEPDFRAILLFGLNGLFEGAATGETFNEEGKTDILIRVGDRNIFMAECLIWKGAKGFLEKLDGQLFTYANWRDTQLVAIVFNRKRNFTGVVQEMQRSMREHSQFVCELPCPHESSIRCVFKRADDGNRHFFLTAIAYEVPRLAKKQS